MRKGFLEDPVLEEIYSTGELHKDTHEDNKEEKKEEDKEEECKEIIIIRKPCDKSKRVVKIPSREDIWPRRMRTDITEHYH